MDIHKPKAAHSWREFLIEIGTIICGILIALGLEQAVEVVHRNAEVREARELLRDDLKTRSQELGYSIEEDRCVLQQLDRYDAWADGGAKPDRFRMYSTLSRSSVWETVKGTAVPHMSIPERVQLTNLFDLTDDSARNRMMQLVQWDQLDRAWSHGSLQNGEARKLHEEVAVFRTDTRAHAQENLAALDMISAFGIQPSPLTKFWRDKLAWVCGGRAEDPFAVIDPKTAAKDRSRP